MGSLIVILFSLFVAANLNNNSTNVEQKDELNQSIASKPTVVKEEVKLEPIKEEVKLEPIKEEVKLKPVNEEVKKLNTLEEEETNWLKLVLYAVGIILAIVTGKYFFSRQRNNSSSVDSSANYMRTEFKEEVQSDTTEQEPTQDEVKPETTEQEPTQDEVKPETTEQELTQDEVKPETTEQEPTQDEVKPETTEQEPTQDEVKPETTEQEISKEEENNNK